MCFSVVIPTLNEEKYIGKTLQCLCDQSFKDFEVLVVDCGSADKTAEEVKKFEGKLNLTFILSPVRGPSAQRNYGGKSAKGEVVVFFDADISIKPDFLEKLSMEYKNDADAGFITSWAVPISNNVLDHAIYFVNNLYLELMKNRRGGAVGSFISLRRSVFGAIGGFDETIVIGEDFEIAERVVKKGYKYRLLSHIKVGTSVRRLVKEGRFHFAFKCLRAFFYVNKYGYIRDFKQFDWEFGNHPVVK